MDSSSLTKDKIMSSYPMLVWKPRLLRDFNPNEIAHSGNPKRNSSQIPEGKRYQPSTRFTYDIWQYDI